MTDRELLDLAAKAAGVFMSREELAQKLPKWEWDDDFEPYHLRHGGMSGPVIWYGPNGDIGGVHSIEWSPLTDDGDALRLAVKLAIAPIQDKPASVCAAYWTDVHCCHATYDDDPYAATRRAIVRAAAAIGEAQCHM